MRRLTILSLMGASVLLTWWVSPSRAYVEAPMTLGSVLVQSSNVLLMRVEAVDREKNLIIYRKVRHARSLSG